MKTLTTGLVALAMVMWVVSGCSSERVVKDGDTVAVHYTGTLEDGTVFDSSREREPLEFVVGSGNTIPGFDNGILGMAVGDTTTLTIPPEEAYGEWTSELVMTVGKEGLPADFTATVGHQIQMQHPSGATMSAVITGLTEDSVTFDTNHPLAGKTLVFAVELMEIK